VRQLLHLFQFPLNCHLFKKYRRVGSGFFKLDWELIILLKTDLSDFTRKAAEDFSKSSSIMPAKLW
jgi:hypothetical protein